MIPGFEEGRHPLGEADYFLSQGGCGPPVLLLHGFPETHACWHRIAPRLAEGHCVAAADLRGYGSSEAPPGGPRGEGYTKREMGGEAWSGGRPNVEATAGLDVVTCRG